MDTRPLLPYDGGNPTTTFTDIRHIIEHAIDHQPRSLQTAIGPSELGNPCDHCLAAKLAGWDKNPSGAWLPFIGTATHDHLAAIFHTHELYQDTRRFIPEHRVTVGHLAGVPITGTCDLFDAATGTVIDFKIVGATTLDRARRHGPTPTYLTQVNLYALGWANAGQHVEQVAIYYLPRNAITLDAAVTWTAPHDPGLAHAAIARGERFHTNLTALAALTIGARDQWITSLPRADGCWDCSRYPDRPDTVPIPGGHEPTTIQPPTPPAAR